MAGITIELSEYVIDAIANAVVKKMQETKTETLDKIRAEIATLDDAISRQAIIDMAGLSEWFDSSDSYNEFIIALSELPSVTPKQKIGHWKGFIHSAYHGTDEYSEPIWRKVTIYHCNQCNRRTVIKEKFCPNCGAKMESENKE